MGSIPKFKQKLLIGKSTNHNHRKSEDFYESRVKFSMGVEFTDLLSGKRVRVYCEDALHT